MNISEYEYLWDKNKAESNIRKVKEGIVCLTFI